MTDLRCVVIDIDDTLYLERDYVRSGFAVVGRWVSDELNVDDFSASAWRAFLDGKRQTIFNDVLRRSNLEPTESIISEMVKIYREHPPRIELLSDARRLIDRLDGNVALAVVSDGPLSSQQAKSRALGLDRWFDPIVLTAELGPDYHKPSRRAFEMIEHAAQTHGDQCVYLADNPHKDFQGPKALRWRTIRVRRREGLHHDATSTEDVDAEVPDLDSVDDLLGI